MQRAAQRAVRTAGCRGAALEHLRCPPGHEIDRAGEAVAPVERALRALDDLDALDVEQVEIEPGPARDIDAVEEDLDVVHVAEKVVLREAADRRDREIFADQRVEDEPRGQRRDIAQVADTGRLDVLRGEGRDRDRDRLQAFGGLAGRHDDFLELESVRRPLALRLLAKAAVPPRPSTQIASSLILIMQRSAGMCVNRAEHPLAGAHAGNRNFAIRDFSRLPFACASCRA